MNNIKSFQKFTCCKCLEVIDILTEKEPNPLYLCSVCVWNDKTRNTILIELDGAPAGYVKGTNNRVKNSTGKQAFTENNNKI